MVVAVGSRIFGGAGSGAMRTVELAYAGTRSSLTPRSADGDVGGASSVAYFVATGCFAYDSIKPGGASLFGASSVDVVDWAVAFSPGSPLVAVGGSLTARKLFFAN